MECVDSLVPTALSSVWNAVSSKHSGDKTPNLNQDLFGQRAEQQEYTDQFCQVRITRRGLVVVKKYMETFAIYSWNVNTWLREDIFLVISYQLLSSWRFNSNTAFKLSKRNACLTEHDIVLHLLRLGYWLVLFNVCSYSYLVWYWIPSHLYHSILTLLMSSSFYPFLGNSFSSIQFDISMPYSYLVNHHLTLEGMVTIMHCYNIGACSKLPSYLSN